MNRHFDRWLNVKELLTKHPTDHILELGALYAENTAKLLSLARVTTITDGRPGDLKPDDPGLTWKWGVSYLEMPKLPDASFGCIIIDTDHNYWTLHQELNQCPRLLKSPGWIMMHDTATFGEASGSQPSYRCGRVYPTEDIKRCADQGLGMRHAINEFLFNHPEFVIDREVSEHHGAMALRRMS